MYDGTEYNVKWEHTSPQQRLKDELCNRCWVLDEIVTGRQKVGSYSYMDLSVEGEVLSLSLNLLTSNLSKYFLFIPTPN